MISYLCEPGVLNFLSSRCIFIEGGHAKDHDFCQLEMRSDDEDEASFEAVHLRVFIFLPVSRRPSFLSKLIAYSPAPFSSKVQSSLLGHVCAGNRYSIA